MTSPSTSTYIDNNIMKLIENRSSSDIISFLIGLTQYIQLGNQMILENMTINRLYKLKKIIKQNDNIIFKNNDDIINFFKECEKLNTNKIYQSVYVINRINHILKFLSNKFIIFPCNADKTPRVFIWNKITFKDTIKLYSKQELEFTNIGLQCGKGSGVIVVDIDTKDNGMEYWKELLDKHNNSQDIDTLTTITGSLGKHYYFKYNESMDDWTSINKIFSNKEQGVKVGIDLRTKNGYVIIPPSIHIKHNRIYTFNDINKPIADIPSWLFNEINQYFIKKQEKQI